MSQPEASCGTPLRRPNRRLTFEDAVEVWKRHLLGETERQIAQAFGVYEERIKQILKEHRHVGSRRAAFGKDH